MVKAKRPLILLPGFVIGKYSMSFWKRKLGKTYYSDCGYLKAHKKLPLLKNLPKNSVTVLSYHDYNFRTFGTINQYAKRLYKPIEYILANSRAKNVDILAHSMGGLVARKYIQNHAANKIKNLIMLGTPNQGTTKAKLSDILWFKNKEHIALDVAYAATVKRFAVLGFQLLPEGAQLYRNSEFITNLNKYNLKKDNVTYTTFAGTRFKGTDLILEASSVALDGAKNIQLNDDHASLLHPSGEVWNKTLEVLLAQN